MATGNKFHKDKLFAKISHTATSGVVGQDEVWPVTSSQLKHDINYNGTFYDCDYVYNVVHGDLA